MRWAGHVTHGRKYRVFWKNMNGGDRYEYSGHKHENNIDVTDNCKLVGSGKICHYQIMNSWRSLADRKINLGKYGVRDIF